MIQSWNSRRRCRSGQGDGGVGMGGGVRGRGQAGQFGVQPRQCLLAAGEPACGRVGDGWVQVRGGGLGGVGVVVQEPCKGVVAVVGGRVLPAEGGGVLADQVVHPPPSVGLAGFDQVRFGQPLDQAAALGCYQPGGGGGRGGGD
ncbi:hypothetical protein E1298_24060, partial [Actinomadura rubrisoli]